jgi:hypothetical protein
MNETRDHTRAYKYTHTQTYFISYDPPYSRENYSLFIHSVFFIKIKKYFFFVSFVRPIYNIIYC